MGNNKAFTLAEVLITLGIIGVVAAITIPVIIEKHKERVTVTKVQKAYSVLSQAYKRIEADYGPPSMWSGVVNPAANDLAGAIAHRNLFLPYLNGIKTGKPGSTVGGEYKTLDNSTKIINKYFLPSITTGDGIVYQFCHLRSKGYIVTTGRVDGYNMGCSIMVDIDGYESGPGLAGHDIFCFEVSESIGIYPAGLPGNYLDNTCNLNSSGKGCTAYVLREKNLNYLKN